MSAIERMMRLLQLFELAGGQVDTRIKIQKIWFLLAASKVPGFQVGDFQYHYYGPYSRNLSNALQQAVASGFLQEEHEGGEDRNYEKYTYKLNSKAAEFLNASVIEDDRFSDIVRICKNAHWRTLELAATVRFLELEGVGGRDQAFSKALKLKPDTVEFESSARQLLARLR